MMNKQMYFAQRQSTVTALNAVRKLAHMGGIALSLHIGNISFNFVAPKPDVN